MMLDNITFGNEFPNAAIGDRVAYWLVVLDERKNANVVRRCGPVIGKLGKHAVLVQDEVLTDESVYVGRDMLFVPGDEV